MVENIKMFDNSEKEATEDVEYSRSNGSSVVMIDEENEHEKH